MVQSSAADIDAYRAEAPEERKDVLVRRRQLCRAELKGFDEVMALQQTDRGRCGPEIPQSSPS